LPARLSNARSIVPPLGPLNLAPEMAPWHMPISGIRARLAFLLAALACGVPAFAQPAITVMLPGED
jgi:hypothetical protein